MKHIILRKSAYQKQPLTEFYLWNILAQGLVARLKRIKFKGQNIAIIGPGSAMLKAYCQQHYLQADIECFTTSWQLTAKHYDLVVINGVLAWFNSPAHLLEDIYAALNVKGLLLLSMLGPETLLSLQKAATQMNWQPRTEALVDMHHWGDCLLQTGFMDPVMDREDILIRFNSPQDWFKDWRAQGLQDPSMPAARHLLTKKKWQIFLDSAHPDASQAWEAHFECLYGHAYKPAISKQKLTEEGVVVSLESLRKTLPSQS